MGRWHGRPRQRRLEGLVRRPGPRVGQRRGHRPFPALSGDALARLESWWTFRARGIWNYNSSGGGGAGPLGLEQIRSGWRRRERNMAALRRPPVNARRVSVVGVLLARG